MNGFEFERERVVRDDGKRRWTPWLVSGAVVVYAFMGLTSVTLMASPTMPFVVECGMGAPFALEGVPPSMPMDEPIVPQEDPARPLEMSVITAEIPDLAVGVTSLEAVRPVVMGVDLPIMITPFDPPAFGSAGNPIP